ncbi:MAG: hypothetical protein AB1324_08545 [Candidatus Micrarchaeota archaeon]
MAHPYRELVLNERKLTAGEKLRLGLKGLLKGEPLLEQARHILNPDNGFALCARSEAAVKVASADSTENIFVALKKERDGSLVRVLSLGFRRAYQDRMEKFRHDIHTSEAGIAAISSLNERRSYNASVGEQVFELVSAGVLPLEIARDVISQVERNKERV